MSLISIQSSTVDRVLRIVLIVVVAFAVLALIYGGWILLKHRYDNRVIGAYVTKSNAQAESQMGVANSAMAAEEKTDTTTVTTQRQELRDASNPPAVPDGLTDRQRRGCVILRQQGADLAKYPTCRRMSIGYPH